MRIMTGAPLPLGADSVCMIEEANDNASGHTVVIGRTIKVGEFVRHPGDDIGVGQVLLEPGVVLNGAQIGVLASQDSSRCECILGRALACFQPATNFQVPDSRWAPERFATQPPHAVGFAA